MSIRSMWREDQGYTMPMTLFVSMIAVAAGIAIALTVTITTRQASLGRETVQANAAAEAGLDAAYAALEQSGGTDVPCTLTGAASQVSQNPGYSVTFSYKSEERDANGNLIDLPCSPGVGVSEPPYQAVVVSHGTTEAPGFGGADSQPQRMESLISLRAGSASWEDNFAKAVFSDRSITTTNQWNLNGAGADFYTNGDFACNSSSRFDGSVYTQGTANLTNSCRVMGDLWARAQITTSTTTVNIGGSVKSSTAGLRIGNNPLTIGGNVLLAGSLVNSDGRSPNVGGTITQNTGVFENPPQETFPIVRFDPDQWAERGFQVLGWVDYINQLRGDGPAPSWWTSSSYCTIAYQSWSLNEPLLSPAQPTVLDARTCKPGGGTQNLVWNGNSKANELRLRSDLTIIANNFYNTGNLKVQSVDANGNPSTEERTLRIIVPWTDSGTTCATNPGETMKFDAGGVTFDPTVKTFLYTSGRVTLTNGISLTGQIYGCRVLASVTSNINFVRVGGPTDDPTTSPDYKVDIIYKRDV